jgi:TonB family protein
MRILKIIGSLICALLILGLGFIGSVYWTIQRPRLPKGWPSGSVWIGAPSLRWALAGVWIGCRLDSQRNVDTCKFANFRGKVWYEGDYTTCDDEPPIADERLWLRPGNQSASFIGLRDGTLLIAKNDCDFRNRDRAPVNRTLPSSPNKSEHQLIYQIAPLYPAKAKAAGITGNVVLKIVIGTDGGVKKATPMSGDPMLTQAAIDAVRQWRYQPTLQNSKPVEVEATVTVQFRLYNPRTPR